MFHYLGKVIRGPKPGGGEVNFASGGLSAPLGVRDSSSVMLGPKPGGGKVNFASGGLSALGVGISSARLGPKPGGGEEKFPTDPDIFALSEI